MCERSGNLNVNCEVIRHSRAHPFSDDRDRSTPRLAATVVEEAAAAVWHPLKRACTSIDPREEAAFERGTDLELVVGRVEFEPMYEGVEDVGAERGCVGIVGARLLVPRVPVHRGTDGKNECDLCTTTVPGSSPSRMESAKTVLLD